MANLSEVTNAKMLEELGSRARLGKLFAFFDEPLFANDGPLNWVQSFGARTAGPKIVSLLDLAGSRLPGARHEPLSLQLDLGVLVTDRDLYREGVDTVKLTTLDPLSPSMSRRLVLKLDGTEYRRIPVRLNMHGLATVPLSGLPVGRYSARFEQSESEPISFTVAEYRLAALVATLEDRSFKEDKLHFTLALNSFGHPVEGEVMLELVAQGKRSEHATLICSEGRVSGTFPLKGEGPFSLNVQMVSELSKTATIPISGSRASERTATLFGRLGTEIVGSLLPASSSETDVRGLYLREAGMTNSPFTLERVDSLKAKITARTDAQSLTVVVADPTVVNREKRSTPDAAPSSACYRAGKEHYREGHFSAAIQQFEQGRDEQDRPNCHYAYEIACCYARLGRNHEALAWLRRTIAEGWNRFAQIQNDPSFETLRTEPGFTLLSEGGRREVVFGEVKAGQELEIDVPSPLALVAVGAYLNGKPFEGWSFLVPPPEVEAELKVPESAEPGSQLEIEVRTNRPSGVYLVVKDERLQSSDTPVNRLAGCLKTCVEQAQEAFKPGQCLTTFAELSAPAIHDDIFRDSVFSEVPYGDDSTTDSLFDQAPPARRDSSFWLQSSSGQDPVRRRGLIPREGAPVQQMRAAPLYLGSGAGGANRNRPILEAVSAEPVSEAEGLFDEDFSFCLEAGEDLFGGPEFIRKSVAAAPTVALKPAAAPPPTTQEDPEILYAGILETRDGRVVVKVDLPDNFGQFVVQATVLCGKDWSHRSASCQVKADPYISIEVPPFIHPLDRVRGRLLISPGAKVELYLDDEPQQLNDDNSFLIKPGLYRATVTSAEGQQRSQTRRVNEPGRLKRIVQSVQLLQEGQTLSLADDPSIQSLRVLPGLEKPFQVLVKETANYGHLCCEQTAAKMVSAALMVLSGNDDGEAIFVAGCHRMQSMLLPSGGFSMYPQRGGLDTYWGPKAVYYLLGLAGMEGRKEFSEAMSEALQRSLKMARDSRQVYRITWPAERINDCQSAYWSLRQAGDPKATDFVNRFLAEKLDKVSGKVEFRAQACYAAATLLLSKTRTETALELTNKVMEQLEDGRLYSTYDSVAAIILMNELRRAGIGAGVGATIEIDGRTYNLEEALKMERIEQICCKEKLCMVSVTRLVEESWESFDATVPLRLSLQKDGRAGSSFQAGDALDLKVQLEEGYQTGDLVWVCLPDCLSRLVGGGQVKRFSVDFEGLNEVTIPLAATGVTGEDSQHFAVCVRNMFEEERIGSPGLLKVRIS
jgi:hypothetical protein